jgi:PAS domain S-box-containing protein
MPGTESKPLQGAGETSATPGLSSRGPQDSRTPADRPHAGPTEIAVRLEDVPFPYQVLDAECRLLAVNAAWRELFRYEAGEVLGRSFSDFLTSAAAEACRQCCAQTGADTNCLGELEAVRKDGAHMWIAPAGRKTRDPNGRLLAVHCAFHDVTDRKHAERELRARTQQLQAIRTISEEITRELDLRTVLHLVGRRLSELVGHGRGGVCLWDEAAQLLIPHTVLDEENREQFGLKLGQGVAGKVAACREGLVVNDYRHWPGAPPEVLARTRITAIMAAPLLYRDRLVGVIHMDTEDARVAFSEHDRELLRLFASHAAIAIEHARLFRGQERAYRDLERAQEEMVRTEKLRALGQMAAGIAHDLNNKLAAILGQAELLKLRGVPLHVREGLLVLETAATDAAQVVRRLRDFARQGETAPLAPVDLGEVVREAVELTRPRWEDEPQRLGARIRVEIAPDALPPILGHAPEIREALANLIFNAVDAMPEGGTLSLAGKVDPEGVLLAVRDTGRGIADEIRHRIFEPFFTTKGVKGSGLGLSVAYGIMARHGGNVSVASVPGQGTTVTLRFQRVQREDPRQENTPGATRGPARRVLVIDDEPLVRRTVGGLLEAAGHTVIEADSGAAGLASFAGAAVDCVLTDLGMPGMNGWEVARAIKARAPQIPVLLLTGWADQAEVDMTPGLVERVLHKPIRFEELLQAVSELVHRPSPGSATPPSH